MRLSYLLLACALGACGGEDDEPPRCADPRYGDGRCDIETSCGAPDIDCFTTFETQADAQQWYEATPTNTERPAAPASDARYARMQALIDDGWAAYQEIYEVGDLAKHRVQLVLIDRTNVNAFVLGNEGKIGLAVMVHKGLIDADVSEDSLIGVIMHELDHAVKMHVFGEVKARIRAHYVAPVGSEPLGFEQTDDATVGALLVEWANYNADLVGYHDDAELRGLPVGGELTTAFEARLGKHVATNPAACQAAKQRYLMNLQEIAQGTNPIDGSVSFNPGAGMIYLQTMTALQNDCFANLTSDAITVVMEELGVSRAQVVASIDPARLADIEGKPFVQGVYNWGIIARTAMRDVQARFTTARGVPWSRLRYYSTEEAADDASVGILAEMGLEPTAIYDTLLKLKPGVEASCRSLLASGAAIPYGENLTDDHHGDCWRAGHVEQVAARNASAFRPAGGKLPAQPVLGPPQPASPWRPELPYSH